MAPPGCRGPVIVRSPPCSSPQCMLGPRRTGPPLPSQAPGPQDGFVCLRARLTQVGGDGGGLSLVVSLHGWEDSKSRVPGTGWMSPCRAWGRLMEWGLKPPDPRRASQEGRPPRAGPCSPTCRTPSDLLERPSCGSHMLPVLQLARIFVAHTCQVLSAVGAFASEVSHSLLSLAFPARAALHSPGVCVSVVGALTPESPCCLRDTPRAEALFLAPRTALLTF